MPQTPPDLDALLDPDHLLLIVVGAHLRAELYDRPPAYALQHAAAAWIGREAPPDSPALVPLVCTDVWYLNQPELRTRPVIALGAPGVNALSAMLAARLPCIFSIRDRLAIYADLTLEDLTILAWGEGCDGATAAAEVVRDRYLTTYLQAVLARQRHAVG